MWVGFAFYNDKCNPEEKLELCGLIDSVSSLTLMQRHHLFYTFLKEGKVTFCDEKAGERKQNVLFWAGAERIQIILIA